MSLSMPRHRFGSGFDRCVILVREGEWKSGTRINWLGPVL